MFYAPDDRSVSPGPYTRNVQPGGPRPFFPGHVRLAQTVDKLQNAASVDFNHRLHYQPATAIQDRDGPR